MRLKEITIEVTQRCPNYCIHCSSLSSLSCSTQLSIEDIRNVVDDAVLLGAELICISGGEPFMHPQIVDIIRYIYSKEVHCNIYTSGIIHDGISFLPLSERTLFSIQGLVDKLIFNVEAADKEAFERIMGVSGGFELMQASIVRALRLGFVVESHTVLMKANASSLPQIMALGNSLGISKMSFLRLVMQGRAVDNKELAYLTEEETYAAKVLIQQCSRKYQGSIRLGIPLSECAERINCMAGTVKLNVRYDGNVYPCEAFKNGSPSCLSSFKPENVKEKRLKEIYSNSSYLNDIRNHLIEFQQVNTCETCMSQYYMKNKKG